MSEQPGEDPQPKPRRRPVHPERQLDERASRMRGRFFLVGFFFALAAFLFWFGGSTLSLVFSSDDETWLRLPSLFLLVCAAASFTAGFLASLLLRVQLFLSDLIFLTAVAGFLLSLAAEKAIAEARGGLAASVLESILVFTPPALFFVGGVAWGLLTAKRLEERRPLHRMALMVAGWFLLTSIPAVVFLPIALFAFCTSERHVEFSFIVALAVSSLLVLLGLPGAYIEFEYRRARRKRKPLNRRGTDSAPVEKDASAHAGGNAQATAPGILETTGPANTRENGTPG